MSKRIKIKTVHPSDPNSDGTELLGYFFEAFGEGYNLYSPTSSSPINPHLLTPANPTVHFYVPGNPHKFTLTCTHFPREEMIGTWSDMHEGGGIRDVPGSGTFQAQAGGTGTFDEEAAAASAK